MCCWYIDNASSKYIGPLNVDEDIIIKGLFEKIGNKHIRITTLFHAPGNIYLSFKEFKTKVDKYLK